MKPHPSASPKLFFSASKNLSSRPEHHSTITTPNLSSRPEHHGTIVMRSGETPVFRDCLEQARPSRTRHQTPYYLWLAILLLDALTPHAHAQGCTQCLDSARATPPAVQAAYRHAIFLLGGVAAAIFLTGTLLLRRPR